MKKEFDLILVGSGIAATLVAQRLLEAQPSLSLLMLEAGRAIALRDRATWWNLLVSNRTPYSWTYDVEEGADQESFTVGATTWKFAESRVRALGGSTMHWGGWSLRYKEEDFKLWSRTGRGGDWPYDYDELEPWYALAEDVLSVGGVASDDGPMRSGEFPLPPFPWSAPERLLAEAFRSAGLVPGHMPIARFNRCMTTGTCKYCPIGSRYTAQDHLAELVRAYPRALEILTGSTAQSLLMEKRRARGVKYVDAATGEERVALAERVVICAGAYESPKLLLQSTSPDWPHGVGNATDQVGRYLVTHSMLIIKAQAPTNPERWLQEYDFPTLMSRSWDTPERQRDGKIFLFNDRSRPNVDIARLMMKGRTRSEIEASLNGSRQAGLHAFIEEAGTFENRLQLGPGVGKFGLRQTRVQFDRDPDVKIYADKVLRDMGGLLEAAGYTILPDMKDGLQYPRGDHSSGTCRMGISPANSVTDPDLQVHGTDNVYVCSNAVLPNAAAVNPTLTLAALALRLGTHLASSMNHA